VDYVAPTFRFGNPPLPHERPGQRVEVATKKRSRAEVRADSPCAAYESALSAVREAFPDFEPTFA